MYRIRDWAANFENNRTKEIKRLDWLRLPAKLDGDGYTELLDHKDGASHYGAWVAIVIVASRCRPRGDLIRESGKPHDAGSLSRITRIPTNTITAALDRLTKIGWVEAVGQDHGYPSEERREEETRQDKIRAPQDGAVIPQEGAAIPQAPAVQTAESCARELKKKTGSSLNPCRDQVRALLASPGWTPERASRAVSELAMPGMAPWDFVKVATGANGHPKGGMTTEQILAYGRDMEARHDAR